MMRRRFHRLAFSFQINIKLLIKPNATSLPGMIVVMEVKCTMYKGRKVIGYLI